MILYINKTNKYIYTYLFNKHNGNTLLTTRIISKQLYNKKENVLEKLQEAGITKLNYSNPKKYKFHGKIQKKYNSICL